MKPHVCVVNTASCYRVYGPLFILFKNGGRKDVVGTEDYIEETVLMPEDTVRIVIQGKRKLIPYSVIQSMYHADGAQFWRQG